MGKGKHGKHIENLKKRNKKKIYIVLILIVLMLIGVGIVYGLKYKEGINLGNLIHKEEKIEITTEENQSEEFKKEKEFLGLKFQNNSMKRENGVTYFKTEIKNESGKPFEGKDVKLIFQNEDLSLIANLETKIDKIEAGETINFEVSTSVDLINAYTFKVQ